MEASMAKKKKKSDQNKPDLIDLANLLINFGLFVVALLALIFKQ